MRFLLLSLMSLTLVGCGGSSPPQPPVPPVSQNIVVTMTPAAWVFQYSPNMPTSPSPHSEGWQFAFPPQNGVHYLVHPVAGRFTTGASLAFRVERSDGAQLMEVEPCGGGNNPLVRLFFQRRGDNLSGAGQYEFYRWWSVDTGALIEDGGAISAAVDPAKWSSVFGKRGDYVENGVAIAAPFFAAAANDVAVIGMTFGGCFAGHGVYVQNGSTTFITTSYTAQ